MSSNTGFDTSAATGLQQVLPSRASSTSADSSDAAFSKSPNDPTAPRRLGDFTQLWQFLDTISNADSSGVRSPNTPPTDPDPDTSFRSFITTFSPSGEASALKTEGSHKKTRRYVTFSPTVDVSPCKKNTGIANNAFIATTTALKAALDDSPSDGVKVFAKHVSKPLIKSTTSPEERKINIIKTLMSMYPEARSSLLSPAPTLALSPEGIHIFIDNSNILIGFYDHIKKVRGFSKTDAVRRPAFSFHGLSLILERGRSTAKKVLVGSSPITPAILEARELGYETSILERVEKERNNGSASSGSESAASKKRKVEQAVDEICHLKILESVLDYPPGTIVLASGDGAAGEYSPGFFKVIERCLTRGWTIELVSFKRSLSSFYRDRDFKKKWKDQFRFVALDGFVEDLLG